MHEIADVQLTLRRFAAATNLSIPGRRFVVPDNQTLLATTLRRLGAHLVEDSPDAVIFAKSPVPGRVTVTDHNVVDGEGNQLGPNDGANRISWAAGYMPVTASKISEFVGGSEKPSPQPSPTGGGRKTTASKISEFVGTSENPSPQPSPTGGGRKTTASKISEFAGTSEKPSPQPSPTGGGRKIPSHLGKLVGLRIGLALVLEPKTAVLAQRLADAGAQVYVFSHADETRTDIAAALRDAGIKVYADLDPANEPRLAREFLANKLQLLLDDGSHLIRLAHEIPGALDELIGASEQTTSGLRPLRVWDAENQLKIPVIAANDARSKTLFDNAYGTGQSCLMTILDLLDPDQVGWPLWCAKVVVAGYGDVGRGFAHQTAALGAEVLVAELDPVRQLQAEMDGYRTGELVELVRDADLVVSATGVRNTISVEVLSAMRTGAAVAVAGGVDQEIALAEAVTNGATWQPAKPKVAALVLPNGSQILVLDQGGCINCTAGEGNPIEIMDLSFGVQLAALDYLLTNQLPPGLHPLPNSADDQISAIALQNLPAGNEPEIDCDLIQVYSAALVIPITGPSILGGSVAVKGSRILHVGERDWVLTTLAGTNFVELRTDGVLMPGLVNAHTHLQYTGMAELGQGQYHGFSDWAAAFNAIYDHTSHDWAKAAAAGANQCLRYGTTTVADVVTDAEAGSALGDIGLHGVTYWEVMDWSNSDWQDHGHDTVLAQLAKLPKTPGLGLSPHAPYSLETAPLLDVPDLARHRGMRLHIHLAESQLEAEWAAGRSGALADLWRSEVSSLHALRKFGVGHSATEFIDQLGVLGPDCHVAHGVYTTAQDRQLLRARGTTVALCPRSNQVIGLAAPPVAAYLQEGNQLAVGTDSLSSSPSLDVLGELAQLFTLARQQGYHNSDLAYRLLHAATLGGATALGLNVGTQRVGQLQAGAIADLVFLDLEVDDVSTSLERVVCAGAGSQVATIISGQLRWQREDFTSHQLTG